MLYLFVALFPTMTGCFSLGLGERTTYVQESPETLQRISSLESRLGVLEQTFHAGPITIQPQPQLQPHGEAGSPEPLPAPIGSSSLPARSHASSQGG
jgi:hypothetical protein